MAFHAQGLLRGTGRRDRAHGPDPGDSSGQVQVHLQQDPATDLSRTADRWDGTPRTFAIEPREQGADGQEDPLRRTDNGRRRRDDQQRSRSGLPSGRVPVSDRRRAEPHEAASGPDRYILAYLQAIALIAVHRPDAMYMQIAQTGYLHQSLFFVWAKLLRCRTVAHFHANANLQEAVTPRHFRQILASERFIDKMILLTEPCRRSLVANGWRKDTYVIPNFIDASELPAVLPPLSARKQILYLGRMDRLKGIFEVIAVARLLPGENFVFVGSFADESLEREFISELETTPNARWLGSMWGRAKYDIIAQSRFLLLPTRRDEFPMILIEATILGCIPLTSVVGSVGEIIRDGFNGVYIQADDIDGMAAKIRELQARHDLQDMATNGVRFARDNFTKDVVRDALLAIVGDGRGAPRF
ncbi:MAG: glycosyltransferase family 4 protein [Betaproteobacteria bacterium]|nr:glycosyltransferase family 4 protein [Betaproteobacteria bacterium]